MDKVQLSLYKQAWNEMHFKPLNCIFSLHTFDPPRARCIMGMSLIVPHNEIREGTVDLPLSIRMFLCYYVPMSRAISQTSLGQF